MVKLLFLSSFGLGVFESDKRASLQLSFESISESAGRTRNSEDKQGGQGLVILPYILALGVLRYLQPRESWEVRECLFPHAHPQDLS